MNRSHALGTLLRGLLDRLDADVQARYSACGLDYRPRYTPVVRALADLGTASITAIAQHAGMAHSAISQTVAQMQRQGWLQMQAGKDGRERLVAASPKLDATLPELQRHWQATRLAEASLERELGVPLTRVLQQAHAALDRHSFAARAASAGDPS